MRHEHLTEHVGRGYLTTTERRKHVRAAEMCKESHDHWMEGPVKTHQDNYNNCEPWPRARPGRPTTNTPKKIKNKKMLREEVRYEEPRGY